MVDGAKQHRHPEFRLWTPKQTLPCLFRMTNMAFVDSNQSFWFDTQLFKLCHVFHAEAE